MIEPMSGFEMRQHFRRCGVKPPAPATMILHEVSEASGVSIEDMKGHSRAAHIMPARHCAMARIRNELGYSLPRIGRIFNRDHTTIIHGIRRWEQHWSKQ